MKGNRLRLPILGGDAAVLYVAPSLCAQDILFVFISVQSDSLQLSVP